LERKVRGRNGRRKRRWRKGDHQGFENPGKKNKTADKKKKLVISRSNSNFSAFYSGMIEYFMTKCKKTQRK
jgi:hypothetical protein